MDPVSHGLVGATAAGWSASSEKLRAIMAVGALAAMAPDLDVLLIRSSDPLFQLELHRQFSHSLAFAPLGALLVSLVLWRVARRWLTGKELYVAALSGILTAGLLDAFTSYGTQLLWPFSDARIAWNLTPVVEPFFTLFLLGLCLAALVTRRRVFIAVASLVVFLFLSHGAVQQHRARSAIESLLHSRGHKVRSVLVKPTLGNQILWRAVYLTQGRLYTDAVRTGFFAIPAIYEGESLPLVDLSRDFAQLAGSRTFQDLERFSELSQGYLVRHPDVPNVVGDGRYSMLPTSLKPLWGLEYDPEKPETTPRFKTFREASREVRERYLEMLLGK